jgi:hypothetical protein
MLIRSRSNDSPPPCRARTCSTFVRYTFAGSQPVATESCELIVIDASGGLSLFGGSPKTKLAMTVPRTTAIPIRIAAPTTSETARSPPVPGQPRPATPFDLLMGQHNTRRDKDVSVRGSG